MVQNQILDQLQDVGYVMCNVERYFKDLKIFYLFKQNWTFYNFTNK